MKDKLFKVKRRHVDWYSFILDESDPAILADWYLMMQSHPFMSINRRAYYVLKKHYTDFEMRRARILGVLYHGLH